MNKEAREKVGALFAKYGLKVLRWDGKFQRVLIKNDPGKKDIWVYVCGGEDVITRRIPSVKERLANARVLDTVSPL